MKKKDKYGKADYDDLLRYVQGDMSDEERHALERELQKDLFASDALDGLSTQRIEEVREDLDRLENQLNKRVRSRQSVTWIRIAASIAVILTVGTLYFTVFTDMINRTDRMAVETESQEQAREKSVVELPEVPVKSETQVKESKAVEPEMDGSPAQVAVQEEIQKSGPPTTIEPEPVKSAEKVTVDEEIEISESMVQNEEVLADAVSGDIDTVFTADEEIVESQTEFLVVEEDAQQILAKELAFETESAPSRARSSDIARPTAMAESFEREVSGGNESSLAAKKLSGPVEKSAVLSAVILSDSTRSNPVGGMTAFRKFIADNLLYPVGESREAGTKVILNFNVDSSGRPRDINVIESSGEAYSREAIRVLEEGPDWVTVQNITRLQINFIPD